MKRFEFSTQVVTTVIFELIEAESNIRIAMFQIHNQEVFNVLNEKLKEGVKVEIITLPYDSINENIRQEVTQSFERLSSNGAILHFCKWNVGNPERTTTAVGRWYSFHGKFIVTDKAAIALSANFIQQNELDALLIDRNSEKIQEFNTKFDELLNLFITPDLVDDGKIKQNIIDTDFPDVESLFELPRVIDSNTHLHHWVQDYPSILCPEDIAIEEKLYLVPFDIRGRSIISKIISEANEFVYISTESFTDSKFTDFLLKSRLKDIDIRILTGATSMDFSDRFQKMIRNMLANTIKIRTIEENLHAKLIVTDKHLAVSSINLNKMNLGFNRSIRLWRGNTETISICKNRDIIATATTQYLDIFNNSKDISIILALKLEARVGKLFNSLFNLRSKKEVKYLFAKLILHKEIQVEQFIIIIGKITSKLMRHLKKTMVDKEGFLMALILYYLTERKHDFDQLNEKISILNIDIHLHELLEVLLNSALIEKDNDFYKLKIETLLN